MAYFPVAMPETPLMIGGDVVWLNPLYSGGPPAYVDKSDRVVRINSRALLAWPHAVYEELCRLGAERWTRREVAAAVVAATRYVRRAVTRRR